MRKAIIFSILVSQLSSTFAQDFLYLCVDDAGKKFFSNTGKNEGCLKVSLNKGSHPEKNKIVGRVRIGMSKDQVINSGWGEAIDVKRSTTAIGTTERWNYGSGNALIFKNDILVEIQN